MMISGIANCIRVLQVYFHLEGLTINFRLEESHVSRAKDSYGINIDV